MLKFSIISIKYVSFTALENIIEWLKKLTKLPSKAYWVIGLVCLKLDFILLYFVNLSTYHTKYGKSDGVNKRAADNSGFIFPNKLSLFDLSDTDIDFIDHLNPK